MSTKLNNWSSCDLIVDGKSYSLSSVKIINAEASDDIIWCLDEPEKTIELSDPIRSDEGSIIIPDDYVDKVLANEDGTISIKTSGTYIFEVKRGNLFIKTITIVILSDGVAYYYTVFSEEQSDIDYIIEALNAPDNLQLQELLDPSLPFDFLGGNIVLFTQDTPKNVIFQYSDDNGKSYFDIPLNKGIRAFDEDSETLIDNQYDVQPELLINGTSYTLWIDDSDFSGIGGGRPVKFNINYD